jgi:hypothetical protein
MSTLVVGATGATGSLLVAQLLESGNKVKVIVRSAHRFSSIINEHENLKIIEGSITDIPLDKLSEYVSDCSAIVSCLGHNLNFKGLFGAPRNLVTLATKRLCQAIIHNKPTTPTKYLLMNTTGNSNRDIPEVTPISQRIVIFILRHLLPPHADNENASDILRLDIGRTNPYIEWAVIRPDALTNETNISEYEEYPSPIRNPIFNSGKTSRVNVASFMLKLISVKESWNHWKGQMPVLYNKISPENA